jgi:NADH-quinone oxidoreductase subunit N
MSIVSGMAADTRLSKIAEYVASGQGGQLFDIAVFFTLVGFAFKVSAVPFHFWAPDSYEGAPTPVTAFLSVASKTGGFVALLSLVEVGVIGRSDAWQPILWVLAAASMTVGNLIALRQTNLVRMLAYSSIAQGGFMLVPFAVANQGDGSARPGAFSATVVYLLIYGVMNLGAFAGVIGIARKTRSAEIDTYSGLFNYAPALAVTMSLFLFSLAGIPPLGGWYAKLVIFRVLLDDPNGWAVFLGVALAVNSVIALFYYASVAREAWMRPVPDEDRTRIRVPSSLGAAIGLCALATLAIGIVPQVVARFAHLAPFGS